MMECSAINDLVAPERGNKTLRSVVTQLLKQMIPATVRNGSFVINDVPGELELMTDRNTVTEVLGHVFSTVAAHANSSCIRITAKAYSDVILVQVRDQHVHGSTLAYNLQEMQPTAEKIGGFLGVTSQWKNETVIVFSFPNLAVAA